MGGPLICLPVQLLTGCSPAINATVVVTNTVNLYAYHTSTLLLSYGITLLVAVIANALGAIAFRRNGYSYDLSFASIVSATNNVLLLKEGPPQGDAKERIVSVGSGV